MIINRHDSFMLTILLRDLDMLFFQGLNIMVSPVSVLISAISDVTG